MVVIPYILIISKSFFWSLIALIFKNPTSLLMKKLDHQMNLLFTSWIDIHWTSWTYFINCFQAWEMLGDVIPCFEIINMLMHKGSINIGPHLWLSHGQDKFRLYLINNYKLKKPCYKPWNIHLVYKVVRGTLGCINFKPSLFIFYATIYPWHNNEHEIVFVKSQIMTMYIINILVDPSI
jgi:hypothetical protein